MAFVVMRSWMGALPAGLEGAGFIGYAGLHTFTLCKQKMNVPYFCGNRIGGR